MTVVLRPAVTDADLEAWRSVRMAVLPNERTATVEEIRAQSGPEQLLLLAYLDGGLAGSGASNRSDTGGVFTQPRVLPGFRRRGVGSALLLALAAHALERGYEETSAQLEAPESASFAERFGFVERMRQIEQVRTVSADEAPPVVPAGIRLAPLDASPELRRRLYPELVRDALADLAGDRPIDITEEIWWGQWLTATKWTFVALADNEIAGMAGLLPDTDHPERVENALTAVRRDYRRHGIARALKQQTIHLASQLGLHEIYTWTQTGNEAMQELNRSLGYVDRTVVATVRASLPLPG